MRVWIDCEYNGCGGALISMALVDELGREFYEVLDCPNPVPWVAENVMPILGKEPIPWATFQAKLCAWLAPFKVVHLVADWPEDIALFCRALITGPGTRIDTPPLTMEVRRDLDGSQPGIPHNALSDAQALRRFQLAREQGEHLHGRAFLPDSILPFHVKRAALEGLSSALALRVLPPWALALLGASCLVVLCGTLLP